MAYVALTLLAIGDVAVGLLKGFGWLGVVVCLGSHPNRLEESREKWLKSAESAFARAIKSVTMPILGLGVFFNALPLVRFRLRASEELKEFTNDPRMVYLMNQLLDSRSTASKLTMEQIKQNYPDVQNIEMCLMHWTIKSQLPEVAGRLIDCGLNPNIQIQETCLDERGAPPVKSTRPALYAAIDHFNPEMVKLLLQKNAKVDSLGELLKNDERAAILSPGVYLIALIKKMILHYYGVRTLQEKAISILRSLISYEAEISDPSLITGCDRSNNGFFFQQIKRYAKQQNKLSIMYGGCDPNCGENSPSSDDLLNKWIQYFKAEHAQKKVQVVQEGLDGVLPDVLGEIVTNYLVESS